MRALFFVLLIACNKTESVATTTGPSASAPPSSAPMASASASATPVIVDAGPPSIDQQLLTLTQKWSDALAKHDADALRDVYGAHVTMYGAPYDRAAAVAAKKAALTGDYTQSIASLMIVTGDPDHPAATFDKTWTVHGKTSHVRASLTFTKQKEGWRVTEETDLKTEDMLLSQSCLALVHQAVLSTDDGKAYRGNGYGTMYVCGPPECDEFQIAGIHIDDTDMQRLASFDVDQKAGVVKHAGLELKADPAIVTRMKTACAKEAAQGK